VPSEVLRADAASRAASAMARLSARGPDRHAAQAANPGYHNVMSSGLQCRGGEVAYEDMKIVYGDETSARFQYLMTGLVDFHEQIREALGGVYEHSFGHWRDVYAEILEARGVSLRPGISLDELTMMLTGMTQGLSLRHIGSRQRQDDRPRKPALHAGQGLPDRDRRAIDPGDGRQVADVVDELMAVRVPPDEDRRKPGRFRAWVGRLGRGRP
jgi:hypothetical protein